MNIKMQHNVYQALLAEANHQGKPLARLCNEILEYAAHIYDNTPDVTPTLPNKGKTEIGDLNERQRQRSTI
ncbi:TPA: hypothetical protein JAN03_20255 [Citrobacter freundii]|nr:hypothetical protein [Citrobacter freundii]